uniref:protein arginine N-methyltransferase 9-like n=1 Tax=Styela clava TaxID=7725 RepID=UPI00193A6A11|nr:protein arginine N-methyltransferase 9-like [Styela clava]
MASHDSQLRHLVRGYLGEARQCFIREDYGKSYAFYLLVIKLAPVVKASVEKEFCETWKHWSAKLFSLGKFKELIELYQQGCDAFYECENLHLLMAELFFRMEQKLPAHSTYKRALQMNPSNMSTLECIDNLCREMIDNWTYPMLNDKERNFKFHEAIRDEILKMKEQGKEVHVLDIGSGTGIMSMFAAKHGAMTVTACEMSPTMSNLGKEIIEGNGFRDQIVSLNCLSTDIQLQENDGSNILPHKASVVISETLDAGVFGEGIIKTIDHAWKELLIPPEEGGSVIPSKVIVNVICVESEDIHQKHCGDTTFEFTPNTEESNNILLTSNVGVGLQPDNEEMLGTNFFSDGSQPEPYTSERISRIKHKLLSNYHTIQEVNFNDPQQISSIAEGKPTTINIQLPITADGFLDAVVLCFDLAVDDNQVPKYVITTKIDSECCWEQAVYPVRHIDATTNKINFTRLHVKKSDIVELNLTQHHNKIVLENCIHQDTSMKKEVLPQNLMTDNFFQNLTVFSLHEDKVVLFNDRKFTQSCKKAILRFMETTNSTSKTLNGNMCDHNGASIQPNGILNNMEELPDENSGHTSQDTFISVLDMTSPFSRLPLELTQCHKRVSIHKGLSIGTNTEQKFATHLGLKYVICNGNLNEKYDAVFVDIVEQSGLLHQEAFNNIAHARTLLHPNGKIFPTRVRLMGMVFESEELLQRCSVPNIDQTIGVEIGNYLQEYQATTLSHINMNKTRFTALSESVDCMAIDLNNTDISSICDCETKTDGKITHSGFAHGIFIWSILELDECTTFDTSNSWQQCAIMFGKNSIEVAAGDCLKLEMKRNLSYFTFNILDKT